MRIAWISKEVVKKIYNEVRNKSPFETGGCLLGYWDGSFREVVIEECTGPGPMAEHSKYSFTPDSKWQEKQVASIYEKSGCLWTYLGDWHSHPHGSLMLSWKDKRTLSRIANYKPARAPHPIMILVSDHPRHMRIWRFETISWFCLKVDVLECEIRKYSTN